MFKSVLGTLYSVYLEAWAVWYTYRVSSQAAAVGSDLRVNGATTVSAKTVLGDNVNFNGLTVYGGGEVRIGDNFHSGSGCKILTRNHNYDDGDAVPYDDTYVEKPVSIGDNVWLGIDVTVLPGVHIEEGAIVQAGSTVVRDVPKGAIVGGHPAEIIDYRDMDHYEELKRAGQFH